MPRGRTATQVFFDELMSSAFMGTEATNNIEIVSESEVREVTEGVENVSIVDDFTFDFEDLIPYEPSEKIEQKQDFEPLYKKGDRVVIKNLESLRNIDNLGREVYFSANRAIRIKDIYLSRSGKIKYVSRDSYDDILEEAILGIAEDDYRQKLFATRCVWCNNLFEIDEIEREAHSHRGDYLCENCKKRRFVLPYHALTPDLKFYGNAKEPFLGVELEVDGAGEDNYNVAHIMPIINKSETELFAYCSHDSSLERGFEITTQPATLKHHQSMRDRYAKTFSELIKMGYRSHNTSTCGIHIHFNRNYFGMDETASISKLLYMIEKFWDEIIIFSRRDYSRIEQYSKKLDEGVEDFFYRWDKSRDHEGHYYAVNIVNRDTIEIRVFRGTLNIDTFFCILEFVNTLVKFAKKKSNREIQRMEFSELLSENCLAYFNKKNIKEEKESGE